MQDSNQGKLQVTLTKPSFNTNLKSDFSAQYIVTCRTHDQRSCGWEDLPGCKENQWSLCKRNSAFDVIRSPHIQFRESLTENKWLLGVDMKKTSHTYPVLIFAQFPTMTNVRLGSPLGSGISPTLTKLQSPPWERGWEGKEKKAGRNQTITEHKQTEKRETPYRKGAKGLNCRNSSVHSFREGSREPHHKVLPADVTAHETQPFPVTIKLPSPGAAHGHSLEREVLQPEYQARWVLSLSSHACFDVITAA